MSSGISAASRHALLQRRLRKIAFAAWLLFTASPTLAQYYVSVAPDRQSLLMTLAISPTSSERVLLPPRGVFWGAKSQVSDVRCSSGTLEHGPNGMLRVPSECALVTWKVALDPVLSNKGAMASTQRSLSFDRGRWILLAEPTSILQISGDRSASDIAPVGTANLIGATPEGPSSFRLPSSNSAPEFYAIGSPEVSRRQVGGLSITDVADAPGRVTKLNLTKIHTRALEYLTRVVPIPVNTPAAERSLLVIWIGVARSQGQAGGAAGSRSFLANYILDDEANASANTAVTTMIIAHEQFHQLVDMLRGSKAPLPTWLSESLAQYYGLKALAISDSSQAAQELRSRFINPNVAVTSPLLDVDRENRNGNRSNYGLFYSEGATFWSLVDGAIESATAGRQGLDDYAAELLAGLATDDGGLPNEFIARMDAVVGDRFQVLVAMYVSANARN